MVTAQETTKARPVPVAVRCPACGAEALVTPAVGEIVAVYHLCPRPDGERRPPALTRMEIFPAPPGQTSP